MKKVLKERRFKAGYVLRTEKIDGKEYGSPDFIVVSAYTLEGLCIGSSKMAFWLCQKREIKPELADPSDRICSIGFSAKHQKWFGWSHRGIYGFGIGDIVGEGDCCASSGFTEAYLKKHPEADKRLPVGFIAKTLEDCRRMAIAFADSVG